MSLISYEGISDSPGLSPSSGLFLLPLILRVAGGFLAKDPTRGMYRRCYVFLALFALTTSVHQYFMNYWSFVLVLINLHIVLLTANEINKIEIPHYLEMFNVLSFYCLIFTPVMFWVGAATVWVFNSVHNLMCGRLFIVGLALAQCACGITCVTAVYLADLQGFYVMMCASLSIMIGQIDLMRK
jgi:hypothetical protein